MQHESGAGRQEQGVPRIVAAATAVPPHTVTQDEARGLAAELFAGLLADEPGLLGVFDHAGVATRRTSRPLDWYRQPHGWGETADVFVETALALLAEAARDILAQTGCAASDIDHLVVVTSTGVATPSLDARLCNILPFRSDVRRTPLWGLGCAGGVAGLARAREFALADPSARVLLLAVELCSLTFQSGDGDRRTLVAASLFGDGCGAALVCGAQAPRPPAWDAAPRTVLALRAAHSVLWPDTEDVMGWTVDDAGLHVVFSRDIPTIVREWVRPSLDVFLARHPLTGSRPPRLVLHPGGPKVLAAYRHTLAVEAAALRHARDVLHAHGNMSSPTCLFVLDRSWRAAAFAPGDDVLFGALGPGFCAEYVLGRADLW